MPAPCAWGRLCIWELPIRERWARGLSRTKYSSGVGAVKEKCLPNPWNAVQLGTTASAADVSWKFVQKETEISNHRKEKEEKAY